MMGRIYFILAIMMLSVTAFGQTITDVDAFQDGNIIVVQYSIDGAGYSPSNGPLSVVPSFSVDGGKSFTVLKSISGDLKNLSAGRGYRIRWRVLDDYVEFVQNHVIFKVEFAGRPVASSKGDVYYRRGQECEMNKKYADAITYYRLAAQNGNKKAEERIKALQLYFW